MICCGLRTARKTKMPSSINASSPFKQKKPKKIQTLKSSIPARKNKLIEDTDGYLSKGIINLLVDLSVEQANSAKQCFFCQNYLWNCSILQRQISNNITFQSVPYLPDVSLINNFNAAFLLQYANSLSDTASSYGDEKNTNQEDAIKNEIANNFDLQFDFLEVTGSTEIDEFVYVNEEEIINAKYDIQLRDNNQDSNDPKKTLEYFGLRSLDDMFVDSDDKGADYDSDNTIIYSPYIPTKDDTIIVLTDDGSDLEDNTETIVINSEAINKPVTKNIAQTSINSANNLPNSSIKNDIEVIQTNASVFAIEYSKCVFKDNNEKILPKLHDKDDYIETDNEPVITPITINGANAISNKTINLPNSPITNVVEVNNTNIIFIGHSKNEARESNDDIEIDYETVNYPITKTDAYSASKSPINLSYSPTSTEVEVIETNTAIIVIEDSKTGLEDNADVFNEGILQLEQNQPTVNKPPSKYFASSTINSPNYFKDKFEAVKTRSTSYVIIDSDSDFEDYADKGEKFLRNRNDNSDNKVIVTYVITDSESDLEICDEEKIQYSRY
ncbi:jg10087 [Pararge aegeria aegeria]|uniref:Jg10087 protein n=1 Tax=Pararge aegeria aegeria TaxID=348720 RepID=A0A8S4SGS8_9NEOP|nr:jg10087 [Pararge aegeria aegeria]